MAYTKLGFINGSAPALSATNLNHMDDGIDANDEKLDALGVQSTLEAEATPDDTDYLLVKDTEDAGKVKKTLLSEIWTWIKTNLGSDKAAVLAAINVEDGADVTDEANVTAIAVATDEVTAAPAHWWVLVGGALKRMTHAGWTALVLAATGKTNAATGFTLAGGTTPKTLTVSADADTKDVPTADEKTRLGDIQAATGATTALKLANLTSPATPTQQGVALLGANGGATKLTKMPDGATAVASQATRSTTTGWNPNSGGSLSVVDGKIRATWIGSNNNGMIYDLGGYGQDVLFRIRASRSLNASLYNGYIKISYVNLTTSWQVFRYKNPIRSSGFYAGIFQAPADCQSGDWIEIDWIWAGNYSYLTGSLSEEAARIANELGDTAGVGAKAQATLTSTGTAPSDGDTVTIGGKAYTFKTVLGTTEGQVLIGADAAAALDNLKTAVNSTGVDAVQYCAAINPLVEATTNTDTTQLFEARTAGLLGNQITVAESSSQLSFANPAGGTTTLSGGKDAAGDKIKAQLNAAIGAGAAVGAIPTKTATSIIGYFAVADCASGAQVTLPAGGTWAWEVTTYGATYNSVKSGTSAGGAAITGTASANLCMRYERVA